MDAIVVMIRIRFYDLTMPMATLIPAGATVTRGPEGCGKVSLTIGGLAGSFGIISQLFETDAQS